MKQIQIGFSLLFRTKQPLPARHLSVNIHPPTMKHSVYSLFSYLNRLFKFSMAFVLITALAMAIHQEAVFDLPDEPYVTNALYGFFKQNTDRENKILVTLEVTGENQMFGNQTHVSPSEDGTWGLDPANALKSSPADLTSRYISFYSVDEENRPGSLQNIFVDIVDSEDRLRIPLDIRTSKSAWFILNWTLPDTHTSTTLPYDTGVVWPQMATAPSWRSTSAVRPSLTTS